MCGVKVLPPRLSDTVKQSWHSKNRLKQQLGRIWRATPTQPGVGVLPRPCRYLTTMSFATKKYKQTTLLWAISLVGIIAAVAGVNAVRTRPRARFPSFFSASLRGGDFTGDGHTGCFAGGTHSIWLIRIQPTLPPGLTVRDASGHG